MASSAPATAAPSSGRGCPFRTESSGSGSTCGRRGGACPRGGQQRIPRRAAPVARDPPRPAGRAARTARAGGSRSGEAPQSHRAPSGGRPVGCPGGGRAESWVSRAGVLSGRVQSRPLLARTRPVGPDPADYGWRCHSSYHSRRRHPRLLNGRGSHVVRILSRRNRAAPVRTPIVGSCGKDHVLGSRVALLAESVRRSDHERPHRTLRLETPQPKEGPRAGPIRAVRAQPVLRGLHRVANVPLERRRGLAVRQSRPQHMRPGRRPRLRPRTTASSRHGATGSSRLAHGRLPNGNAVPGRPSWSEPVIWCPRGESNTRARFRKPSRSSPPAVADGIGGQDPRSGQCRGRSVTTGRGRSLAGPNGNAIGNAASTSRPGQHGQCRFAGSTDGFCAVTIHKCIVPL